MVQIQLYLHISFQKQPKKLFSPKEINLITWQNKCNLLLTVTSTAHNQIFLLKRSIIYLIHIPPSTLSIGSVLRRPVTEIIINVTKNNEWISLNHLTVMSLNTNT